MSNVFVLDPKKQPVNPVHPGRARVLLSTGQAAVFKRHPFTLILTSAGEQAYVEPLRIKIDPGSKITGLAIVNDARGEVVFAAELHHRGHAIKAALADRRAARQSRRQRQTRYRKPRFQNRHQRKAGWLPPSLESRLTNVLTWVERLRRLCPLTALSMEVVKFDLHLMQSPEIQGMEYQQGTLAGYEVREYLLEKWERKCAYCEAQAVPLQVEHIHARAKGGSHRASNLTLACEACNRAKGTQDIRVFLAQKPEVLARILAQAQAPLKDAAAVNVTRWALYEWLKRTGLPLECGSGGGTKYNRSTRALPKAHWIDAACVGKSTPAHLQLTGVMPLLISAHGSGHRQMCGTDKHGFPTRHRSRQKRHHGFQTGDMVRAVVPGGKKAGVHVGRVLVRATGSFDIRTTQGRIQGISHRYCTAVSRCDGYSYGQGGRHSSLG